MTRVDLWRDRPDDLHAIQDLVRRAHRSQHDVDALVGLHTEGAVIVNLAGRRVLGATAFAEAMSAALASPLADVHTTVEIVDVRPCGEDSAIASCIKTVRDERSTGEADEGLPSRAALSYVVVKVEGAWKIALAQSTPMMGV